MKGRAGLPRWAIMIAALLVPTGWAEAGSSTVTCEGPSVDAWVSAAAERVRTYDDLFAFAVDRFGEPTGCDGRTATEFDGARFGTVQYDFSSGVTFHLETMPPAVSIVTLRSEDGFADPEGVIDAVRLYSAERGLAIDWEAPERGGGGDRAVLGSGSWVEWFGDSYAGSGCAGGGACKHGALEG